MGREWEVGDVLVCRGEVSLVTSKHPKEATEREMYVETAGGRCLLLAEIPADARPLVVIDPEDREQVERLVRDNYDRIHIPGAFDNLSSIGRGVYVNLMEHALREFATPTAPKPEEPTEDGWYAYDVGRQTMIFRLTRGQWYVITDSGQCDPCEWGYISQALGVWNLVRVLSEGVTP